MEPHPPSNIKRGNLKVQFDESLQRCSNDSDTSLKPAEITFQGPAHMSPNCKSVRTDEQDVSLISFTT